MAALFDIPTSRRDDTEILKKAKKKKTSTTSRGGSIVSKINAIQAMVEKHLGKYADETLIIQDEQTLIDYINKAIENGKISIDTETMGLDPLVDDIVGPCIYTAGMKTAYVPINHKSYVTGMKCKNQLSREFVSQQFQRLADAGTKIVMFNAPFDLRQIKHNLGVVLHCWWDCKVGSRCLNENELKGQGGLKKLHQKYVLKGKEDAFKFDELFSGITFDLVPIKCGGLYAAHDAKITWEYQEYQEQFLYYDPTCSAEDRNGMNGVSWVFFNIEMPMVDVIVELEDNGVVFDFEYNDFLKEKYHKLLSEREEKFHEMCEMYRTEIDEYRGTVALDNPINIKSSQQLSVLLYEIAKVEPVVDKKTKKPLISTKEEVLKALKHPLADAILDYREFSTIVSTFIDKLPNCVNSKDGRVHCNFNQYGADTGRMSSSNPNMQNIPSHNKDIRKMFKATDKEYDVFSDDNCFEISRYSEILCSNSWIYAEKLQCGDMIDVDGEPCEIESIECSGDKLRIHIVG